MRKRTDLCVAYGTPGVSATDVDAQLQPILANVRTFVPGLCAGTIYGNARFYIGVGLPKQPDLTFINAYLLPDPLLLPEPIPELDPLLPPALPGLLVAGPELPGAGAELPGVADVPPPVDVPPPEAAPDPPADGKCLSHSARVICPSPFASTVVKLGDWPLAPAEALGLLPEALPPEALGLLSEALPLLAPELPDEALPPEAPVEPLELAAPAPLSELPEDPDVCATEMLLSANSAAAVAVPSNLII